MKTNYILLALFLLTSCASIKTDSFKELTVEAGENQFKPASHAIYLKAPNKSYQVWFDSSAAVVHPLDIENDWNKGEGGISWSLLSNHKNSVRWAWRWNPIFEHIELTWYAYINGVRSFGLPMAAVEPDEMFGVDIKETEKGTWRIQFETDPTKWRNYVDQTRVVYEAHATTVPFAVFADIKIGKSRTLSRNIPAWWGGTYPAPREAKMYVKRIK